MAFDPRSPSRTDAASAVEPATNRPFIVQVGLFEFLCNFNELLPFRYSDTFVRPMDGAAAAPHRITVNLTIGRPVGSRAEATAPPTWLQPDERTVRAAGGWQDNPLLGRPEVLQRLRAIVDHNEGQILLQADSLVAVDFGRNEVWQWVEAPATVALLRRDLAYVLRPLLPLWAARHHALFLHASAVAEPDGPGFVFLARSGGGKSTVAGLAASEHRVLGDDHICIDASPKRAARVFASPFNRLTHGPNVGQLRGICLLRKAPSFGLRPLAVTEALPRIWADNAAQWTSLTSPMRVRLFDDLWRLLSRVPLFEMSFPRTQVDWSALGRAVGR